ncbi:MAG: M20/M25/M40 family metallo-hydrolase [Verrucomicrobiota bacterium]
MTPAAKLLCELIALPSVNPAFLPAGDPRTGEQRVMDFLTATAGRAGLGIELQPVFPGRSNVLARLTPAGRVQRRIVLAPHMDTVGGREELDGLLRPKVKHGRVTGRGACDTKGSVAAMLTAVLNVAKARQRPARTEIVFAALVDEENGQTGSRALAASGFKANLAIVGEPTRLKVVTAHKGNLWLQLETRGKSAHGSKPELGRNAVHEMAQIVDLLQTTYASRLKRRRHPLLGHATVNVGTIAGGTQTNVVPAHCEITVDRRTLPGETEAGVRRELNALLKQRGLKARVGSTKGVPCLPLETDFQMPLVQELLRVAGQKRPVGVDFFCDASPLAQGGIPGIVFGPGDIAQAHTADEWIALDSLERGTALLTRYLQSLP